MRKQAKQTRRPNVMIFIMDQQRRDSLGCYGNNTIQTPNLDKIAEGGVIFDNAFTTNPVCMPSRASMLTGRYPLAHGVKTNGIALPQSEITLPDILKKNGYKTASVGKIHLSPLTAELDEDSPESMKHWEAGHRMPLPYYGFQKVRLCDGDLFDWTDYYLYLKEKDEKLLELLKKENALTKPTGSPSSWKLALPEEYHASTWIGDESIKFLEGYVKENAPFLMHISFPGPHFPYVPPAPYCYMYDQTSVPMPRRTIEETINGSKYLKIRLEKLGKVLGYSPLDMPEEYIREIIAHTYGLVTLVDKNIGRIIKKVEELNLSDNTIILFISDHGEHLGDHWLIYKALVYDELIRIPMIWKFPGHLLTGKRLNGMVSNIDIMPTILDLAGIEVPYGVQGNSIRAGLEGRDWNGRDCIIVQDDDPRTNDYNHTLRTNRYRLTRYAELGIGELYDFEDDPNEFKCVFDDPRYKKVRDELILQMLDMGLKSIDPLPTGKALC